MIYLIIGFAIVYLDFGIAINEIGTIGLIPDFIGWFFIFYGLKKLSHLSMKFARVKYPSLVTGLLSVIIWVLDAVGVTKFFGAFSLPLMGALCFMTLLITYRIIEGIDDIETDNNADLNSKRLYKIFLPLCVTQSIGLLTTVFGMQILSFVFAIALLICVIIFIVFLTKAKQGFDALPEEVKKKKEEKTEDE